LGSDSVKIAESSGGKKLEYISREPVNLPNEPPGSEKIMNRYREILKKISQKRKLSDKKIQFSIQDESIFVKYLELPKLSRNELKVALPIEVERFYPLSIDKITYSYSLVPVLSEDKFKIGVVISIIPKRLINEKLKLFSSITSQVLDKGSILSTFALAKTNVFSDYYEDDKLIVQIDVGHRFTTITLSQNNKIFHSRYIGSGGRDFTEAFRRSHQVSFEEAEQIKLEYDISTDKDDPFEASLRNWAREVKRTINYYRIKMTSRKLEMSKILLSGGGARMKGLLDYLEKFIGIPSFLDSLQIPGISKILEINDFSSDDLIFYKTAIGLTF